MGLINWKGRKEILFWDPVHEIPTENELELKPEEEGVTYIKLGLNRIRNKLRAEKITKLEKKLTQVKLELTAHRHLMTEINTEVKRTVNLISQMRKNKTMAEETKTTYSSFVNHKGEPLIKFDDAMNNVAKLNAEYDITVDTETGEVWIANNNSKSEVILQGSIRGYAKKDQNLPGALFDFQSAPKDPELEGKQLPYKTALFSGAIDRKSVG